MKTNRAIICLDAWETNLDTFLKDVLCCNVDEVTLYGDVKLKCYIITESDLVMLKLKHPDIDDIIVGYQ